MNADSILKTVFGILLAVLAYMGVDTLKRLRHLESDTVRKSDLKELLEQLRDEHKENREDMSEIKGALSAVHRRIDRAFLGARDQDEG